MAIPSQLMPFLLAAAAVVAAAHLLLPAFAEQRGLEEQEQQQQQQQAVVERPGCQDMCGNISIPFPFGMGKPRCFLPGFEVTCDTSSSRRPRLFLAYNVSGPFQVMSALNHRFTARNVTASFVMKNAVELMDISVAHNEARAYRAVSSSCSTNRTHFHAKFQYTNLGDEGPFLLSAMRNVLIGVGSNVESMVMTSTGETGNEMKAYMPSCLSNLMGKLKYATDGNGTCSGLGCCQAALPLNVTEFGVSFMPRSNLLWQTNPCFYGMLVEKSWYNFSTHDLYGNEALYPGGVPIVLDFAIRNLGSCPAKGQQQPPGYVCVSGNSTCDNTTRGAYVCKCLEHYRGNPYIVDGCHDIDECELPDLYPCRGGGICANRLEGYDCPCKPGMHGDGKNGHCTENLVWTWYEIIEVQLINQASRPTLWRYLGSR